MLKKLSIISLIVISLMTVAGTSSRADEDLENTLYLDLSTGGRVVIQMRPDIAPNHVERIKTLTRMGFYDGVVFHRVVDGFMAQTGDPSGTGRGASELPDLAAEITCTPHLRGTVSMARGPDYDSANSQFFIVFQPSFNIDNQYTVWGRVISGIEYVDAIQRGVGEMGIVPEGQRDRVIKAVIAADAESVEENAGESQ